MKQLLYLITLITISCTTDPKKNSKVERENEPDVFHVTKEDAEMNNAIELSRKTLDKFEAALKSNNADFKNFALKVKFGIPDGASEHIWVGQISMKNSDYYGIIDNVPEETKEVNYGDTVKIKIEDITDWLFVNKKILQGGNTIRVLRNRMTPKERAKLDSELDYIIRD